MQRNFYANLPLFTRFEDVTHAENYTEVPSGWWVLIGDVVGSTQAIEVGRYKEVNVVGASIIIAVLNAAGDIDLPYSFGGDGAALLVPEAVLPAAKLHACPGWPPTAKGVVPVLLDALPQAQADTASPSHTSVRAMLLMVRTSMAPSPSPHGALLCPPHDVPCTCQYWPSSAYALVPGKHPCPSRTSACSTPRCAPGTRPVWPFCLARRPSILSRATFMLE